MTDSGTPTKEEGLQRILQPCELQILAGQNFFCVCAPGGGGGDMQVLHMGVLTKFFSPLEKRGSLGAFCTFQTCPPKKGTVFVLNKNQGKKAPRDPHWNL